MGRLIQMFVWRPVASGNAAGRAHARQRPHWPRSRTNRRAVALLGISAVLGYGARVEAWVTVTGGPLISSFDEAYSLVEVEDSVVVSGRERDAFGTTQLTVRAFDRMSGQPRWRKWLGFSAEAVASVVRLGSTVAVGGTVDHAFAVVCLDAADGRELWRAGIRGGASGINVSNAARRLVAAGDGDVVAVGHLTDPRSDGLGSVQQVVVARLAAMDGHELWRTEVGPHETGEADGLDVAMTPEDDVVVGGFIVNGAGDLDGVTARLAGGSGQVLWATSAGSPPNDRVAAVRVGSSGDVFVAGEKPVPNERRTNFFVARLGANDGQPVWTRELPSTVGSGRAEALTLDPIGDVVAAGTIVNPQNNPAFPTAFDFTVAKLAAMTGELKWIFSGSGTASNSGDIAHAVATDGNGDVYAAGEVDDTGTGIDFAVLKLNGATGQVLWNDTIDGSFGGVVEGDIAVGVAVGTPPNVYAWGRTKNNGTGVDWTVATIDTSTGTLGGVTLVPVCNTDLECADTDACSAEACTTVGCSISQAVDFEVCRVSGAATALDELPGLLQSVQRAHPQLKRRILRLRRLTQRSRRTLRQLLRARRIAGTRALQKAERRLQRLKFEIVALPVGDDERVALLRTILCAPIPDPPSCTLRYLRWTPP